MNPKKMTKRKTIFWRLLPSYWAVILISLIIFTAYAFTSANTFYKGELEKGLTVHSRLLAEQMRHSVKEKDLSAIQASCKLQSKLADQTRFTVIDLNGTVMGDSHEDPKKMNNHRTREEIDEAIRGNYGEAERLSPTLQMRMMYVATPLTNNQGTKIAVIRAALPMNTINQTLQNNSVKICFFR